jgi:hypothetical protein
VIPVHDLITLIAQQGGTLGLAIAALWWLNKVWELRLEETKRYADELKEMNCEMRNVIDRNTEAWMRMMQRVKE